ncbi:MAG: helix-turn-helix transcriptional regulator [Atopobiaceae bacterium]|nr:helix-turn-helix transcriptional regulator [Atopobiaceae bacterium]
MVNNIESERRRLGLTQEELGVKLGKGRSTIVRWEADPFTITGTYLVQLAQLFECSTDYLLGLTAERVPQGVA